MQAIRVWYHRITDLYLAFGDQSVQKAIELNEASHSKK